jgi:putative salt-induced outer membrane protein YdiY
MIEIPITVQYHFGKVNSSHWYAAAGVSSYLMKKEEYYYLSKYYATQYYAEKEYKNSIQNWFSVLQIGAGYQLQLGKKSTLRFEPYIKLPMSKIGIAQMPLSSAGINIGYILPLK